MFLLSMHSRAIDDDYPPSVHPSHSILLLPQMLDATFGLPCLPFWIPEVRFQHVFLVQIHGNVREMHPTIGTEIGLPAFFLVSPARREI